jgi:hypothetical protein
MNTREKRIDKLEAEIGVGKHKPGKKRRLAVVDMDHLVSILKGKGLIADGNGD